MVVAVVAGVPLRVRLVVLVAVVVRTVVPLLVEHTL
tara:strand:+ start:115 stop:222 length:108 start_codon:yes stop_codon:yes gene_type:complete